MKKDVLLINDMAGYGKVALSVMIPTLSKTGHRIHNLVSAIVSNTLDYGKFEILDTTDYMKQTINVWDELNFHFDAIATGFIVDLKQAQLVCSYCHQKASEGAMILCDPIMGDNGSLYPGMEETRIDAMRVLVKEAMYMIPNYTEACFLSDLPYEKMASKESMEEIIKKLHALNHQSVVITSVPMDGGHYVCGYDHKRKETFYLAYDEIDVRLPGTGDIFASMVLAGLLDGQTLKESAQKAMDVVYDIICRNKDNEDLFAGVNIEEALEDGSL